MSKDEDLGPGKEPLEVLLRHGPLTRSVGMEGKIKSIQVTFLSLYFFYLHILESRLFSVHLYGGSSESPVSELL